MREGADSLASRSLASFLGWLKQVVDLKKLQELHISFASPFDMAQDWFRKEVIQGSIIPHLKDLEAYLIQQGNHRDLLIKIFMKCGEASNLKFLQCCLSRLERCATLVVEGTGKSYFLPFPPSCH